MGVAVLERFGNWCVAALILATVYHLDRAPDEVLHAALCVRRVLKRDVMPTVSATGERRLTIEQPVPLKSRGGYPGPFSCQAGDLITVAESEALHVLGNRLIGGRCCVKMERC